MSQSLLVGGLGNTNKSSKCGVYDFKEFQKLYLLLILRDFKVNNKRRLFVLKIVQALSEFI